MSQNESNSATYSLSILLYQTSAVSVGFLNLVLIRYTVGLSFLNAIYKHNTLLTIDPVIRQGYVG